jgi:hypothetical protein
MIPAQHFQFSFQARARQPIPCRMTFFEFLFAASVCPQSSKSSHTNLNFEPKQYYAPACIKHADTLADLVSDKLRSDGVGDSVEHITYTGSKVSRTTGLPAEFPLPHNVVSKQVVLFSWCVLCCCCLFICHCRFLIPCILVCFPIADVDALHS